MVIMDIRSHEEHEETLTLLKLLALGQQQIETGHYRPVEGVLAELDAADRA
jgi:hypothetical protein